MRPPIERDALARSFLPQFQKALQKIIEIEVDLVRKVLESRSLPLGDIYGSQIPKAMKKYMSPLQWGYYEAVFSATEREIGMTLAEYKGQLDAFTKEYISTFQLRYTSSHGAQLKALKDIDAVAKRLQEWLLTGAARRAADEITRQGQSVFRESVNTAGYSVVWHVRSAKACSFCRQLNGVKIRGKAPFVPKMTDLTGVDEEGEKITMMVYHDTKNPPLHAHCSCFLSIN